MTKLQIARSLARQRNYELAAAVYSEILLEMGMEKISDDQHMNEQNIHEQSILNKGDSLKDEQQMQKEQALNAKQHTHEQASKTQQFSNITKTEEQFSNTTKKDLNTANLNTIKQNSHTNHKLNTTDKQCIEPVPKRHRPDTLPIKPCTLIEYAHVLIKQSVQYYDSIVQGASLNLSGVNQPGNKYLINLLNKKSEIETDIEIAWDSLEESRIYFNALQNSLFKHEHLAKITFLQAEIYLLNEQWNDAVIMYTETLELINLVDQKERGQTQGVDTVSVDGGRVQSEVVQSKEVTSSKEVSQNAEPVQSKGVSQPEEMLMAKPVTVQRQEKLKEKQDDLHVIETKQLDQSNEVTESNEVSHDQLNADEVSPEQPKTLPREQTALPRGYTFKYVTPAYIHIRLSELFVFLSDNEKSLEQLLKAKQWYAHQYQGMDRSRKLRKVDKLINMLDMGQEGIERKEEQTVMDANHLKRKRDE